MISLADGIAAAKDGSIYDSIGHIFIGIRRLNSCDAISIVRAGDDGAGLVFHPLRGQGIIQVISILGGLPGGGGEILPFSRQAAHIVIGIFLCGQPAGDVFDRCAFQPAQGVKLGLGLNAVGVLINDIVLHHVILHELVSAVREELL